MRRSGNLGRRKFQRLKATYLVTYRARFSDRVYSHYFSTLTKDISCGGMSIMAEELFPRGTELELVIRLPMYPQKKIDAKGEVISVPPQAASGLLYKTSIRFTDFDEHAFKKLNEFILQEMDKVVDGKPQRERVDRRKE